MKRLALVLTVVSTLAVLETASANAADNYRGNAGHAVATRGYASYGHGIQNAYAYHGYIPPAYGHGYVQNGHGYAAPVHGSQGYRSYGHSRGIRISAPHFGLRIGH